MKINFDKDINGFQEARRLKIILEHYAHLEFTDKSTLLFIESLIEELNNFLADPGFEKFNHSKEIDDAIHDINPDVNLLFQKLSSFWRKFSGPSKREILLSKQRHELIERAERAEAMAYDAIAETAEVGRQRDIALQSLKELQSDNNTKHSGPGTSPED